MPTPPAAWPLVGRDDELTRIGDVVRARTAAGVVLVGPGGVGKSRLARAVLDRAASAGIRVARVLATASASSVPLGALAPLVGGDGDAAPTLAGARGALVEHAAGERLVLLVDDAHLLDDLSSAVVLSVADEASISILATIRAGEPCPDAVTALWKDAGALRIDLDPLGRADVERLLAEVLGGRVSPAAVDRLLHLSSGLPLALRELVDDARARETLRREDRRWIVDDHVAIPRRIAELIEIRLGRVGERARDLVATLALTEPLPLPVLDALGYRAEGERLEEDGMVVVEDPPAGPAAAASPITGLSNASSGPTVRLAHPLYGEVALAATGTLRQRSMLSAASSAFDALPIAEHDRLRSVLWRHRAGDPVDVDRLLEAAQHAFQVGDHHATGALARAAWDRGRTFESGHLLGFALGRTGDAAEADAVLAATEVLAADDRQRVLVAVSRVENLQRGLGDVAAAQQRCLDAEQEVLDPTWRVELRAHRSMILTQRGRIDAALALVEPVLADPDGAPRAFVRAAYAAGIASVHAGQPERATEVALEALPRHEVLWAEDVYQTEPGVHHLTTLFALIGDGRLREAGELLAIAREVTRPALPRYGHGWMCFLSGLADLIAGRVVDAARHFDVGAPIFLDGNQREVARWCLAGAATADALRGATADAAGRLEQVDELRVEGLLLNEAMVDEARGWTAAALGDRREAAARFSAGAEAALAVGDRFGGARLLHARARVGDASRAAADLRAVAGECPAALVRLLADHAELVSVPTTVVDVEGLADALAARGLVLFTAEVAAEAARRAAREGDPRASARWAARSAAALGACQGARTHQVPIAEGPQPLTARERDVARLAAERLASKEIAARLGLSRRTVDNYLRRVYRKLGVSSRHELPGALGELDALDVLG